MAPWPSNKYGSFHYAYPYSHHKPTWKPVADGFIAYNLNPIKKKKHKQT